MTNPFMRNSASFLSVKTLPFIVLDLVSRAQNINRRILSHSTYLLANLIGKLQKNMTITTSPVPHDLLLGNICPVDIFASKMEVHGDSSFHFLVVNQQGILFSLEVVTAQVFAIRQQQFWLTHCRTQIPIGHKLIVFPFFCTFKA